MGNWKPAKLVKMEVVNGEYVMTGTIVDATVEPEAESFAELADGTKLAYEGSWTGPDEVERDLYMDGMATVAYVRLHELLEGQTTKHETLDEVLKNEVTVTWSFNEGQAYQLTQIMLRAAMEGKLDSRMQSRLYDWHLCRKLDLNLDLIEALESQIDDMECDYHATWPDMMECRDADDPNYYKTEQALCENWGDLMAVKLILQQAIEQIDTAFENMCK